MSGTLASIIVLLSASIVAAQTSSLPSPRDVVIESNRQEMDNLLLRKPILSVEDKAARLALLKQIKDDFRQLQISHNQMMTTCVVQQVNYKCTSKQLEKISARANRLKSRLGLPEEKPSGENKWRPEILTEEEFKTRLVKFDEVVGSFVQNPIFKEEKVIDVGLAKKAGRDLASIIESSRELRKASSKLSKL